MKTLVLTNDFPPRGGGIETFIHEVLKRQDPSSVAVLAASGQSRSDGATREEVIAYDANAGFDVARLPAGMWPRKRVADIAATVARDFGCGQVWLPSCAPHGLIVPMLQQRGLTVRVATTHGAEAGMAAFPVGKQILRAAAKADVLTYLGAWTRSQLERALGTQRSEQRWARFAPGVDLDTWQLSDAVIARREELRADLSLERRPVVACVSRLVPRKGQDRLIQAWPAVMRTHPDAVLLLVGTGESEKSLRSQAGQLGSHVKFTGRVSYKDLPAYTSLADVATLPARARLGGLDVEGLGIVLLEAAALGIPTIACATGGVPDALIADETGLLLPTTGDERSEIAQLADAITHLLSNADLRARMGSAGRQWVREHWTWDVPAAQLARLLSSSG